MNCLLVYLSLHSPESQIDSYVTEL